MNELESKEDLIGLIDSDKDAHLKFLSSFIKIRSTNPPGDTRDAVKFVQECLSGYDIPTEIIAPKPEAPNIVSTFSGQRQSNLKHGSRNLVLNGHIDVFPVDEDEHWQRDPYSGDIVDGFVHGRGGVDMKAGTAADLIAFTYVHRFRSQLTGQCTLEVVSDEETGGRYGTKYLLEQHESKDIWRGDCVLNAEPSGLDSIRFGEKGTLRLSFEIRTQGGHGAYIHRSEGAIRIATRLIHRLLGLENLRGEGMDSDLRDYLSRPDVREVADEIMWKGAADSMLKPTVNIGTIHGGVKVNMIPSYCAFEADIRLPIGLVKETFLTKIGSILKDIPEASYTIQEAASNPAAASPRDHELVRLLQKSAENACGRKPLPISSLGATDCKHFRYNGVPAYSYGVSPATMAEVDERVSVEEFLAVVKVHTLIAWDYLGGAG